ncbi:MAG: hypothetical protein Q7S00_04815, partial [bacterium]|nr:hypothetical protein [bacterium]
MIDKPAKVRRSKLFLFVLLLFLSACQGGEEQTGRAGPDLFPSENGGAADPGPEASDADKEYDDWYNQKGQLTNQSSILSYGLSYNYWPKGNESTDSGKKGIFGGLLGLTFDKEKTPSGGAPSPISSPFDDYLDARKKGLPFEDFLDRPVKPPPSGSGSSSSGSPTTIKSPVNLINASLLFPYLKGKFGTTFTFKHPGFASGERLDTAVDSSRERVLVVFEQTV